MNKRLVQRAMKKLGDQTTAVRSTAPHTVFAPNTLPPDDTQTLIGSSAAAEEAMAARIRADIARADALRKLRAQERAAQQRGGAGSPASVSPRPMAAPPAPLPPPAARPASTSHTATAARAPLGGQTAGPRGVSNPMASAPAPAPQTTLHPAPGNIVRFDFDDLKSRGFLVPDDKTAKIHQEFRLVKRRLLDNAFGRLRPVVDNGRLIMVTSSLPGEGKTFSAINLAISIAIGGEHPVLLVDADIARPNVANTLRLDLTGRRGLTDYLDDPSLPLADMLLRTPVQNLTLLPAGQLLHHPVDLLASANMAALVERLKAALPHHVIIFDSPPLLPVTETRSLSALVGQVLLVVAAGDTPRSAVNEALVQLENCEAVGLLFNKAPVQPSAPAYYGY